MFAFYQTAVIYAQPEILARVIIYDTEQPTQDVLTFKLKLERTSDIWDAWANGTFQFKFIDPNFVIDPTNLEITRMFDSDLAFGVMSGSDLPSDAYIVNPHFMGDRIGIAFAGPDTYEDAIKVYPEIKLEQFMIRTLDGTPLPEMVQWFSPFDYYQACAYKLERDSTINNVEYFFKKDDNIEMWDGGHIVDFVDDSVKECLTLLDTLSAEYVGGKKVALWWNTSQECRNRGFIIKRGFSTPFNKEMYGYHELMRFDLPGPFQQNLQGLGTRIPGRKYKVNYDTVSQRDLEYIYDLFYMDYYGEEHFLASDTVVVPHAVISYAQNNPNPFENETQIVYTIDDECYLDAFVYDLNGKLVMQLYNKEYRNVGQYKATLRMPEFASQGLYDLLLIAYPIDDTEIELSRAIVKMQLVR